jgi:hypothetical protein
MNRIFNDPGKVTGSRCDATRTAPVASFLQRVTSLFFARRYATLSATVETRRDQNVDAFFAELSKITRQTGQITHAFVDPADGPVGYIQLHRAGGTITIHRIWTVFPNRGHGSKMLGQICALADRHGVFIKLKIAPLGKKPYPMSHAQLKQWYHRHGFRGDKKLVRTPA